MKLYHSNVKIQSAFFLFLCLFQANLHADKALTILQSSDIHGNLDFYPRMGAVLHNLPKEERIYLDCGDTIQGSFDAAQARGKGFLAPLSLLKCDAFIPGNHDFDFGLPTLANECSVFTGAVLSANLKSPALPLKPYVVLQKNGLSIAVIGMTDETMFARFLLPGGNDVELLETTTALESILAQPEIQSANLVILARHNGIHSRVRNLYEFLPPYPAIDLVLCGHTHQELPGIRIGRSLIVQPPAEGNGYAEIRALFSDDGILLELQSRLVHFPEGAPADVSLRAATRKLHAVPNRDDLRKLPPPRRNTPFPRVLAEETAKVICNAAEADLAWYAFNTAQENFPAILPPEDFFKLMPYEETIVEITVSNEEVRQLWDEILAKAPPYLTLAASSEMPLRRNTAKSRGEYPLPKPARPDGKYLVALSDHLATGAGGDLPLLKQIVKERGRPLQFYNGTIPIIRDLFWNALKPMPKTFR